MFYTIYSLFTTKNPDYFWLKILIILIVVLSLFMFLKRFDTSSYYEGFTQKEKFLLKQNNDIYDDFYVEIYDQLQKTDERTDFELDTIINNTVLDEDSVILDVGCGTGYLVNKLQNKDCTVFGIDKSIAMCKYAEAKFPEINIRNNDINETMIYDKNTFTHIICDNFTIYEFNDKSTFLKNSYFWLKPNGYLILHLVNRDKFSPLIPLGTPPILDNPQKYSKTRIKETNINFLDFRYKATYKMDETGKNKVSLTETFQDVLTKNVRQNELTMMMEKTEDILIMLKHSGFELSGKSTLEKWNGDDQQYLYFFQKIADRNVL